MSSSTRAPFYDLFKLIVAIILLLIFVFLLIWMRPSQARQPGDLLVITFTPPLPKETLPATQSSTVVPVSPTSFSPIETPTPTTTSTLVPTETQSPTLTPTIIPSPTESPVPERTPTPIAEIPEETSVCESNSPSQLQVGMQATIVRNLNFRSSPGILDNWILTNIPGTQVEIIGGPDCTQYQGGGTYLWWQIKLPNGLVGWSAEASAFGTFYFMEPMP